MQILSIDFFLKIIQNKLKDKRQERAYSLAFILDKAKTK